MKLLGLTGGIGMGKSTADKLLRERGVAVIDTDALAREVVEPGEPALAEIAQTFGAQMLAADGRLRRDEMARIVFADAAARKKLEAILHPRIRERWQVQAAAWRAEKVPVAVVVIPLLFETGAEKELGATICVACSESTQRQRLRARGWSADEIDRRNAAQWSIDAKMARADYVIWTEGSIEVHAAQLERILSSLSGAG